MYNSVIIITLKPLLSNKITWMMGGRRDGLIHRSTYTSTIKIFSNIKQGWVVDIFSPTSTSCTVTPTISYLGGRVAGLGPVSKSTITNNSISWKIHQYNTLALVMGGIVTVLRPIYTSTFNINSCFHIARGWFFGLLWPRFVYINIYSTITRVKVSVQDWPTYISSMITSGRLSSLKRPIGANCLIQRHFKTFFFRTFIVFVTTVEGIMDDLKIPRSCTSISLWITLSLRYALLVWWMASGKCIAGTRRRQESGL